ncbi:MAG: deoxynucleoside kinase [Gammaproteobacteria bacterium]|jgi:deoxyguanosine kinase|nr:deoxynucleoside kinase [Gammaproteobacteria bacterium]MBT5204065.1 deoxynucleoside kinase [Gammaproteobacteria bacterium]MBT5602851.1 deoxynucleoside kinase [Gammaproteobacteria bacterium]MBT6246259.1 deoxynucleoside kinase [Gammaproteobacteria bacterium]
MPADFSSSTLPSYIAVEGPTGVGKTSLTKRLAESFNYETILETSETNPFLDQFYENRRNSALPTQLFFLFDRARQVENMRQGDIFKPVRVADFLIDKDRLFAELNLTADELTLYDKVTEHLSVSAPAPDLVVYLQAPAEVLMDRIQHRGIPREANMDRGYLDELIEAYTRFFHYYDEAPLLIVNSSELDLVNNQEDYQFLLDYMLTIKTGRHYYNPKQSIL